MDFYPSLRLSRFPLRSFPFSLPETRGLSKTCTKSFRDLEYEMKYIQLNFALRDFMRWLISFPYIDDPLKPIKEKLKKIILGL